MFNKIEFYVRISIITPMYGILTLYELYRLFGVPVVGFTL